MPANQVSLIGLTKRSPGNTNSFPAVDLVNFSVIGDTEAGFRIDTDGKVRALIQGVSDIQYSWLISGDPEDVEVMVSRTGTGMFIDSSPTDQWLNCAQGRKFTISTATLARASTFTLIFRNAITQVELDQATIHVSLNGTDEGGGLPEN